MAARTLGVEAARAPILAFTDSDCEPAPGWLEAGLAAIEAGADVVQGLTRPARPARPLERSVYSMRDDGLFATCNVLYRRSAFDAAGGFDGHTGDRLGFRPGSRLRGYGFGEDTLIGWRVRRAGQAVFAPEAVVTHAVFPVDVVDVFTRAWTMGAFPGLLREVPELRGLMQEDLRSGFRRRARRSTRSPRRRSSAGASSHSAPRCSGSPDTRESSAGSSRHAPAEQRSFPCSSGWTSPMPSHSCGAASDPARPCSEPARRRSHRTSPSRPAQPS